MNHYSWLLLSQGKDLYHDSHNKQDCPKQDKGICPETDTSQEMPDLRLPWLVFEVK